jgi:hypothetical protein
MIFGVGWLETETGGEAGYEIMKYKLELPCVKEG